MSLQLLNEDVQNELAEKEATRSNPLKGAFQRLRTDKVGTLLKGEYPDAHRLEELLVSFD